MECEAVKEMLLSRGEELGDELPTDVTQHLDSGCPDCTKVFDDVRKLSLLLKTRREVGLTPPDDLLPRLQSNLRQVIAASAKARRRAFRISLPLPVRAAAAAAAAAAAVVGPA